MVLVGLIVTLLSACTALPLPYFNGRALYGESIGGVVPEMPTEHLVEMIPV
jgi:hypothetical protein